MKIAWWKIVSVLLLLYTVIAGFLVPLRPGIESCSPFTAQAGESISLNVDGYNSNWTVRPSDIRAWLKTKDDLAIAATRVTVKNDMLLVADFQLPASIPSGAESASLTLVVDHPKDGPSVLPKALDISKHDAGSPQATSWQPNLIQDLNFRKSFAFPYRNIIKETIRNTYFHVPLWMAMYALLALATWYNIQYLRKGNPMVEERAYHLTLVALLYGFLGIATGMMWAHFTWGRFWSWDIKQTMSLMAILMFVAYVFIRFSIPDENARRRFNAVYGIFAFVMVFPLLYIVPRMAPSLHPGSGGNPAFGSDDMDNTMRMVFYPAIIGYLLFGLWLAQLSYRLAKVRYDFLLKK